jgi:hypothetical protein
VVEDAHAGLIAEVEAPAVPLQPVRHPKALLIVLEAAGIYVVQGALPGVAEGRVADIVAQGRGLGKVFVELQGSGYGPRQTRHLQRVGQAGAVMVALRLKEDLGLVL